jgi:hypothetical protein
MSNYWVVGAEAGVTVKHASDFVMSTHPVGWRRCKCGEVLALPLMDEVTAAADPDMQAAFRTHNCEQRKQKQVGKSKSQSVGS